MTNGDGSKKKALILAGGGIKVAFQAGVLQVWLDEAGLEFDLADGASGGVFNLAAYCQGMSGTEIADNWRKYEPKDAVDIHWSQYLKLPYAESLFEFDRFRKEIFRAWGLDFEKIRRSDKQATFNVYNFTRHELTVLEPSQMTEDFLAACVALPIWFPPVHVDGDTYIDPVYVTDANLEEAIKRGADELWIIWTVSTEGVWRDGFVANYFQIIESAANGQLKRTLARIEESNAAIAAGKNGYYGRHIEVKMLSHEVPLHYLINFSQDRVVEAVNLGVQEARAWCATQGISLSPGRDAATDVHNAQTSLEFTETMKGFFTFNETDFDRGYREGRNDDNAIRFRLTIDIQGVNRFVTRPDHEATASGYVESDAFGGRREVEAGVFNLFVDQDDPGARRMLYRLFFTDSAGHPLTLAGYKEIKDDPGLDMWSDTTTLFTRILRGHIDSDRAEEAELVGAGILRIHFRDFLKQLTSFRASGPTHADRAAALIRFGRLFAGNLWDVYGRDILSPGPF